MATRLELSEVANAKLADARLLLEHGRWSNSYYLYGYAVEISLKAIVAGLFRAEDIPDRKFVDQVHTHDLQRLVSLAGLTDELDLRRQDLDFSRRWSVVVGGTRRLDTACSAKTRLETWRRPSTSRNTELWRG